MTNDCVVVVLAATVPVIVMCVRRMGVIVAVARARVLRAELDHAHHGEQAVGYEAEQRQERQQPEIAGRRAAERVSTRRCCMLEEHQPLRRLMFARLTVWRWRNSAMMIASPTADSAAATVMTKKTKI